MPFDREMIEALEKDGEMLRQLTGEDHGPHWIDEEKEQNECPECGNFTTNRQLCDGCLQCKQSAEDEVAYWRRYD